MEIVLIKSQRLYKYPFPSINTSSYWIKDYDENDNERELVCIEREDNEWIIESNEVCDVFDMSNKIDKSPLEINKFYLLKIKNNNKMSQAFLYVYNENDPTTLSYEVNGDGELSIGSSSTNSIVIKNDYIKSEHAKLYFTKNMSSIEALDTQYGAYVNNERVASKANIYNGDIVFIMGFKIIIFNKYILINNYNNSLKVNSPLLSLAKLPVYSGKIEETQEDDNALLYDETDYFSRSPRFVTSIVEESFGIDSPPSKQLKEENSSLLMTIGPTITMGMSSLVTGFTAINNVATKGYSLGQALPSILVCAAMLLSTFVWPSISRKIGKKNSIAAEQKRQKKYVEYLVEKRRKIENLKVSQHQVLMENFANPYDCASIILNKKRNLWERQKENNDYLCVRIGTGNIPLKINLNYSVEDFTMSEDNLKDELNKVVESAKEIKNAPVTINLIERNKLVVIGETQYKEAILKSIILQLVTYQCYDDLKLVFMVNDSNSDMWESFKILPHTWSNIRDIRFYANNYDDMMKLSI